MFRLQFTTFQIVILKLKLQFININIFMSWKQTQAQVATDEGFGAAMVFTDQWVDAAQPGVSDGQSAQAGVDLPTFTIDSAEVSLDRSICVHIYIYFFVTMYV